MGTKICGFYFWFKLTGINFRIYRNDNKSESLKAITEKLTKMKTAKGVYFSSQIVVRNIEKGNFCKHIRFSVSMHWKYIKLYETSSHPIRFRRI